MRAAKLLREPEGGAFAIDGEELVAEARAAGIEVEYVLGEGGVPASADALRALGVLGQAPKVVAVCRTPPEPAGPIPPRSLVLARVGDAGNVGSIIRTAAALELPRVTLTRGSADPWSRKALRASMGAAFRPGLVATGRSLEGATLAAAVPRGGLQPGELPPDAAVVLGAEGEGLSKEELGRCALTVTIPASGFESLNVAAAAAILAWHLSRT